MEDNKKTPSTPVMNRSRSQLASAYAPGAFFTFEGGLGSCIAMPDRDAEYEHARIPESAKRQIVLRLAEISRSWFRRAMDCRGHDAKFPVFPRMCVDSALLDGHENVSPLGRERIDFVNPVKMGYTPAPLTFVCNTCGMFKGFNSVEAVERAMDIFRPEQCPNPKKKDRCQWRQLDVVFTHWSGNWAPATPGMYEWDANRAEVRDPIRRCSQCDSENFLLNTDSPSIGHWFFQCADCGHKERDTWLQNDPETLKVLRERFRDRVTDGRMEPISYRASAAFYAQSEQFVIFDDDSEAFISLLDPTRRGDLEAFIAQRYGFGATRPRLEHIKELLRQTGHEEEWVDYERRIANIDSAKTIARIADGAGKEQLARIVADLEADLHAKVESWFTRHLIEEQNELPAIIGQRLNERNTVPSRYDPFVLAVEHEALRQNKLDAATGRGGRRAFVRFTALDTDLAPREQAEKGRVEVETRRLLDQLGVAEMGLIREFDLCRFTYGYTRVQSVPFFEKRNTQMPVRLNLFPNLTNGKKPVYAITQANEALYVQLKAEEVYEWLRKVAPQDMFEWNAASQKTLGGHILESTFPFQRFLSNIEKRGPARAYLYVYTLLHTYTHILMKAVAEHSGLDLGSMGEYLFPADLAFVIYRNGTTMDLGNLSSLWRNENIQFLGGLLDQKTLLCNSGSLCAQQGGACPDCVMVPETSCLAQNQLLSRSVLRGGEAPREDGDHEHTRIIGYLESVNERLAG